MRMPFRHEEPPSRLERVRCAVRERSAGAVHQVSGAAGGAQQAVMHAADVAQGTAHQVADRTTVVAHQVADRASTAAGVIAERARPVAIEAAARGGAAWHVLRHGAPQPSPMARMAAVVPLGSLPAVARRSRVPMGLMAIGAVGAVAVLMWRRSRAGADSVWILDADADAEQVGGRWQDIDSRAAADDAMDARRDSPANRWP